MHPALLELPEASPASLPQRAIRHGRQAPGQLSLTLAALELLCLGTGLAGMLDIQHRRATLAGVAERGGPLTTAAEEIYQSISDADATAAGAFLVAGGIETKELRDRYLRNIREAAAALSTAAAGELAVYLPSYAGLIEDARTLNRQGLPEGGAYLRQASALAQRTMLPLAERLFRDEAARLGTAQDGSDRFPWCPLAVGILTLAGLVAAQVYLARTTNRTLNLGLLVATAATLVGLAWFGAVSASAASHSSAGRERGSAQVEVVAAALLSFPKSSTGRMDGFEADIAREIALAIFGDREDSRIQFHTLNANQRIPAIVRGDVDMVMAAMTMTCDRWKEIFFSSDYYTAGQRILVNSDSTIEDKKDLGGKKACASQSSTNIPVIQGPESKPIAVSALNTGDCLLMLRQRQVDAVSTGDVILAGLRAQDPGTKIVGEPFSKEPTGIGISKQSEDLVRFVNAILENLKADDTWTKLQEKWLAPVLRPAAPPVPEYKPE